MSSQWSRDQQVGGSSYKGLLAEKGLYRQSYGFSSSHVLMGQLDHKEGWVPKNSKLWCWRRLLRVPLVCKEIKPVNPKGNQPWIFTQGLMLKLKHQYFSHLMQRADSLEKTLILGKIESGRRRRWQRMKWFYGITDSMDMSLRKLQEIGRLACCRNGAPVSRTPPSNWTTITTIKMTRVYHLPPVCLVYI